MVGRIYSGIFRVVEFSESPSERVADPSCECTRLFVDHDVHSVVPAVSLEKVIFQPVDGVEEIEEVSFVLYLVEESLLIGVERKT